MSHLRESLSVDLPLRLIFDAPTARRLAAGVRSVQRHLSIPEMPRIDRRGPLPLSYSQERMMFLHLLRPESSAYNIAGAMQLDGPLDVDAVGAAIDDLLERHEILGARYRFTADGPEQTLHSETQIEVQRVDFTAAFDPAHASDQAATDLAVTPFDLEAGPLLRVALHRLGPDLHRLVFCVHHIVADGWSLEVGLQDFIALYTARRTGAPSELEPLATQYVDYAAWQRSFLESEQMVAQEDYWRERLADAPRLLPLPTDRPRPSQQHHAGDVVQIGMTAALVDAATALAREHGATLFMVMLAAFNVVLSRHSGSVDICVGTPIANRNWRAAEGLVGTFVNTLVMRTDCSGNPAFLELIARVREVCLGAYDNQDVPFERLVDTLQTERDMSHSPLFQVFFDFQNLRLPPGATADLNFSPIPVRRHASQFDLSFGFLDFGGGMLGSVEFRTDIFDRSTIERMAEHLMRVLEAAVADPAAPISRLPMFSDDEHHALLVEPNETAVIFEDARPVHAGIGDIEPSRVAVVHGETRVSYGALEAEMNRLAHHLRALGVRPDTTVGVLVERGPSLVVAMLATMQAGGAYIPMDPSYPPARLNAMLEDGRPAVIVTEHALASRLPPVDVPVVFLDDDADGIASHPPTPPPTNLQPENLAYVIFTSGSTGRPKGVMVPHRALTNFLCSMAEQPGCDPDERLLSVTTVSFDIAALELLLPLLVGATVEIAPRALAVDAPRLAEHIRRTRPTLMQATPATWRMLLEAGWEGDPKLRVLCGGEALPRDLAAALTERVGAVWNMYGPTETTIWSSVHPVGSGDGAVPLGDPVANTQLYVLDPNGGPVPHGTIGELYIGGQGVAKGYIGRDDLTAKRFVDDTVSGRGGKLYRTGDAARRARDGSLHFEGRLDNQVKIRGFRIELAEIETQLRAHPFVADAACRVWTRDHDNVELVAYVVCRPTVPESADLRRHLSGVVPDYMVPSAYVDLDEFPRTANGKLDRAALPDPRDGPAGRVDKSGPSTALEARLVALWQEILGTSDVGVDDDFFDLGGHSLLAVRLFVRIAETEGVSIPLGLLFEAATIRALARHIEAG